MNIIDWKPANTPPGCTSQMIGISAYSGVVVCYWRPEHKQWRSDMFDKDTTKTFDDITHWADIMDSVMSLRPKAEIGVSYLVISEKNIGKDGWIRVTYSNWEMGKAQEFVDAVKSRTGADWTHFGCFMDTCCMATKDMSVIGEYKDIPLP